MASSCRSCGKPVLWTITAKGKKMPVDVDTRWDGNIRLNHDKGEGDAPLAEYLNEDQRRQHRNGALSRGADRGLHVSHFTTCPNAKQHRKK